MPPRIPPDEEREIEHDYERDFWPDARLRRRRSFRRRAAGIFVVVVLVGLAIAFGSRVYESGWTAAADSVRDAASRLRESAREAATNGEVRAALALSDRLSAFDIGVNTEDGIVRLTGEVRTDQERRLAGLIAGDAAGGFDIGNLLVVNPGVTPDAVRRERSRRVRDREAQVAIEEAWLRRSMFRNDDIVVRVSNGIATLSGTVDTAAEDRLAGQIAAAVRGVRQVENHIVVLEPDQPE